MNIGIDIREIEGGVRTGIGQALFGLIDYFCSCTDEHRAVLFSSKPVSGLPSSDRIRQYVIAEKNTLVWDQITLARQCSIHHVDLFYSPYYKTPLLAPCPTISTIFDVMYLTFDLYRSSMPCHKRLYFLSMGRLFAHRSHLILTCSDYSKQEIIKIFGVDQDKIRVINLGISNNFTNTTSADDESILKRLGIVGDYLLYMGNQKPHKNINGLVSAFDHVKQSKPNLCLVIAGSPGTLLPPNALQNPDSTITITGAITQHEQAALYRRAQCLIMPSFYEGFGYPPLEAMACGTPVVASNRTSLPEVVGAAALLCDPSQPVTIANAVLSILNDSALKKQLIAKGLERARLFNSTRMAQQMYRAMLGQH